MWDQTRFLLFTAVTSHKKVEYEQDNMFEHSEDMFFKQIEIGELLIDSEKEQKTRRKRHKLKPHGFKLFAHGENLIYIFHSYWLRTFITCTVCVYFNM